LPDTYLKSRFIRVGEIITVISVVFYRVIKIRDALTNLKFEMAWQQWILNYRFKDR